MKYKVGMKINPIQCTFKIGKRTISSVMMEPKASAPNIRIKTKRIAEKIFVNQSRISKVKEYRNKENAVTARPAVKTSLVALKIAVSPLIEFILFIQIPHQVI